MSIANRATILIRILALAALLAAPQLASQRPDVPRGGAKPKPPPWCVMPAESKPVTFWAVTAQMPSDRLYHLVVRAFAESGHAPTASTPAGVEWSLGAEKEVWLGNLYVRTIRATIYPKDSGSVARIEPLESMMTRGSQYSPSTIKYHSLSQRNEGKGLRVWCEAKAISDSLTAWTATSQ